MAQILAADIGGTNIRAAVVSNHGEIREAFRAQIDLGDRALSADELITRLSTFFAGILNSEPAIEAIGIGFPGFFIGDSGVLVSSPNLPNLQNVALAEKLRKELNTPVFMQNDALCAAVGEHAYGAGKASSNLLHITLGTGIGGGLILNNSPYTGENGMAMEFGHLSVDYNRAAKVCGCGGTGCVEAYASATAVATNYFESTGVKTNSEDIFKRANEGDDQAIASIETAGHYLGIAIAQCTKLLDIQHVTISGGLIGAWSLLHPAMMTALNAALISPLKGRVSVIKSTLDDNSGLLGAAALAFNTHSDS